MTWQGIVLVVLAALMTVASNLMLRAGVIRAGGFSLGLSTLLTDLLQLASQPLFVIGVTFYGIAALIWFRVISTESLSNSYPVLVGLTFLLVTLGAIVLFREPVSLIKILGLVLIFFGIVLISRS